MKSKLRKLEEYIKAEKNFAKITNTAETSGLNALLVDISTNQKSQQHTMMTASASRRRAWYARAAISSPGLGVRTALREVCGNRQLRSRREASAFPLPPDLGERVLLRG